VKPEDERSTERGYHLFQLGLGTGSAKLVCDIKSILSGPRKASAVAKNSDGTYRLTVTTQKDRRIVATIDPSKSTCTKIEDFDKDQRHPSLIIDRIHLNSGLTDQDFAIPSLEMLREKVQVQELSGKNPVADLEAITLLARAIYVRAAIYDPTLRGKIKDIDWDQTEANDQKYSQALREAFSPTGFPWKHPVDAFPPIQEHYKSLFSSTPQFEENWRLSKSHDET